MYVEQALGGAYILQMGDIDISKQAGVKPLGNGRFQVTRARYNKLCVGLSIYPSKSAWISAKLG